MPKSVRRPRRRRGSIAVILCAVVGAALLVGAWRVAGVAGVSGAPVEGRQDHTALAARGDPRAGAALDPRWSRVLSPLLDQRALAWRTGDASVLRSVYAPGSAALRADTRMLRDYGRRGLRVTGVRTRCQVVALERQLPDRASLVVVDTLGPAVAHDARGGTQPLPRDLPTRHRIHLVMTQEGWRIAAVSLA